jgi:hypothetical protein
MSTPPLPPDQPLDVNQVLIAEFNYIAQTAFQANEDRSRVSNFYFVTTGAAIGAIFSARLETGEIAFVYAGFAALFLILTLVGLFTLLQLVRLRIAWEDSARAMNVIKDYYCKHARQLNLNPAFFWRTHSVPKGRNWKTVAFLIALSILAISWGTVAATVVYAFLIYFAVNGARPTYEQGALIGGTAFIVGGGVVLLEYWLYRRWIHEAEQKQEQRIKEHYARYKDWLPELSGS